MNILIADDEEGLRFSLASIIEMEGHEVQTAEDGRQALELVRCNSFDVAFFDIRMPAMNGVDAFKEIKKISPETIVVMMTAYAMNDLIKESVKEGAFACISKPFEIEDVLNTVKEIASKPVALVVSRDAALQAALHPMLKSYGYIAVTDPDSDKAFSYALRRRPSLIFADLSQCNKDFISRIKNALPDFEGLVTVGDSSLAFDGIKHIEKPVSKLSFTSLLCKNIRKKVAIISGDTINSNNLKLSVVAKGYDASYYQSAENFFKFPDWIVYDIIIADSIEASDQEFLYKKIKETAARAKFIALADFENSISPNLREKISYLQKSSDYQALFKLMEDDL
ncbi:MAG: response regulator [Endomicrobium sp.]|nr:response regulator [Endomicrobium sp.]